MPILKHTLASGIARAPDGAHSSELGELPWHALPAERVVEVLGSASTGLSIVEARRRRATFGPNTTPVAPPVPAWSILAAQFRSIVMLLLIAAAVVALAMGDPLDAAAIGVVLLLNVALGFTSELRARRAMEGLRSLDVPRATVVRDGEPGEVDARDLVPGDVVLLEAGQVIPADARLVRAVELAVVEATLTGESLPVQKHADALVPTDAPLAERETMVYRSTAVVSGTGRAIVTATGARSEVGRIGVLLGSIEAEPTPLERRLDALGRRLVWGTLVVVALVAFLGLLRGSPLGLMLETGLALAIAAVPEGLPAVVTIAMAVGVRRMARRNALVRRLPTVESLGAATVVCTDKTGTLTAGEMTVTTLWVAGRELSLTGVGYSPEGAILDDGRRTSAAEDEQVALALRIGALANRADVLQEGGRWLPRGDPTEAALIAAARKGGLAPAELRARWPEEAELPFSSERMLMATFHRSLDTDGLVAFVKGAPARVLDRCDTVLTRAGIRAMDPSDRARLLDVNRALAGRGLRVLALAVGRTASAGDDALHALTFVGFAGMIDPPAPGVRETIARFHTAGIRTIMLTGDQPITATAVARELGLVRRGDETLVGRDLAHLSEPELGARLEHVAAVSRVTPEDKLRIVSALRDRGEVVAMLGDGVNDAAALKRADVGVAMGRRGTDIAKDAAGIILLDDRFQTLGAAVEEGRTVGENTRKFIFYLFSSNTAEILVLLLAGLIGLPTPVLPLQILWLNLITDTFPALALALEPPEPALMNSPPRAPGAPIFSRGMLGAIGAYAAIIAVCTLAAFVWALQTRPDTAVTIGFTTLAIAQIFHVGNARSRSPVLAPRVALRNPYAVGAVLLAVGLQMAAVHFPPLARVLSLRPLSVSEWLVVLAIGLAPAVAGQGVRLLRKDRTVATGASAV